MLTMLCGLAIVCETTKQNKMASILTKYYIDHLLANYANRIQVHKVHSRKINFFRG